jgi:major outer membrane protein
MKGVVMALLTSLSCEALYALPVGNPSEASLFLQGTWAENYCCDPCDPCFSWCEAWDFRVGYYGDFVFNRHMQVKKGKHEGRAIDRTEIYTNAGYLVMNICNRIDLFGTIGATNILIKTDARAWDYITSLESELRFRTYFSWSVGGRATLWQCDYFTVGAEGEYFQANTDFDNFLEYFSGTITYFNGKNTSHYSEWQVGLGICYRYATCCPTFAMTPYAAVKWAGSQFNLGNFSLTPIIDGVASDLLFPNLDNGKLWGYAVGISITLCDMVGVNVEGRWADEKALSVNGQFRF